MSLPMVGSRDQGIVHEDLSHAPSTGIGGLENGESLSISTPTASPHEGVRAGAPGPTNQPPECRETGHRFRRDHSAHELDSGHVQAPGGYSATGWSAPHAQASLGGGNAEITFEGRWSSKLTDMLVGQLPPIRRRKGKAPRRSPWVLHVHELPPLLDGGVHPVGVEIQVWRSGWQRLSSWVVRQGCVEVVVHLPAEVGKLFDQPGLFGYPTRLGEQGDDHWRRRGVLPKMDDRRQLVGIDLYLERIGNPKQRRFIQEIRCGGSYVAVTSREVRKGSFEAIAVGLVEVGGRRVPLPARRGRRMANPTSACAAALASFLRHCPGDVDITALTNQSLIREVIRTGRVPRPPGMAKPLKWVQRAVDGRAGAVRVVHAAKAGSTIQEVVSIWARLMLTQQGEQVGAQGRKTKGGCTSSVGLDSLNTPLSHLSTGIQPLDEAIGGPPSAHGVVPCPGFPRGAVSLVWGGSSSGKTTLGLTACATTICDGGTAAYIDLEHEVHADRALVLGVPVGDQSRFRLIQPGTVEEGMEYLRLMAIEGVDLIVVDSIGAGLLRNAAADPLDEEAWDSRMADEWATRLPRLLATIRRSGTAILGIAQHRMSRGPLWRGAVKIPQGGHAWRHYADVEVEMTPAEVIRGEVYDAVENRRMEKTIGQVIWARVSNRLSLDGGRSVLLDLHQGEGFGSTSSSQSVSPISFPAP